MRHVEDEAVSMLSAVDPAGPLEAVLLFNRTGTLVAGWTRKPVPQDVITVMAATLYGSVATLVEALGDASPSTVVIETDLRRMLATRSGPQRALLLVAPRSVSESSLRQAARKILAQDAMRNSNARNAHPTVVVKP